jgi:hypothetical protein
MAAVAVVGGCQPKPAAPAAPAAPPKPETSRLGEELCGDTERPRGFRVEREALAPVLAEEHKTPPNWRGAYELAYGLARQGNSVAVLHLSDLYGNRSTGFADAAEQKRLFDCALKLGAPQALVRQGVNLTRDDGGVGADVRRANRRTAVGLFERAAGLGDLEGVGHLAGLVEGGREGYPPLPAVGREMRELCAAAGDHSCQWDLASGMLAQGHDEGALFWLEIIAARPLAADPPQYAARREAVARRLSPAAVARTRASTKRWIRLTWDEVEGRWVAARDRVLAAIG